MFRREWQYVKIYARFAAGILVYFLPVFDKISHPVFKSSKILKTLRNIMLIFVTYGHLT